MNITELVRRCTRNDPGAREMLYGMFASRMLSVCHRYARTKADAEDIFQEGFLKVFENIKQVRNPEMIEWWMKKIFVNEALKVYNNTRRMDLVEDLSVLRPVPPDEFCISDKIATDEITREIQSLPDKMRMVFNMYVIEGFSHKEISDMMEISEGTSKSNLHDARKLLQKKISGLQKIKLSG